MNETPADDRLPADARETTDGGVADAPREPRKWWRERLAELFPVEPASRTELLAVLDGAGERKLLDSEALNIIHGAIAVADLRARDVMIPRSLVVTVQADQRVEEFLPMVVDSKHSRFPVIGDDMDDLKGILHAKDMLPLLLADDWEGFDIKDYIRRTIIVPESKRLNDLLQEFRETRNHMAVVVDEYGSVAGVVTIEDVLEQIVGEIEDEHDIDDDSFIKQLDEHSYTVKATTPIDDFNAYFDSDLAEHEFDTIGGIVLKELGHLPKREETVSLGRFHFRILNADSRRIRLLHLTWAAA